MVVIAPLVAGVLIGVVATLIVMHRTVRELRSLLRQGQKVQKMADDYRAAGERYYQTAKAHDAHAEESKERAEQYERSAEEMLERARALHTEFLS